MKEATLELEAEVPEEIMDQHNATAKGEHSLSIEEDGIEQIEEGGGRYAKSYFGVKVNFMVSCSCQKDVIYAGEMQDKIAASHMDDLT